MPFPRPTNGQNVRRIKPGTWSQIADLIDRDREQGTRSDAFLDLQTHISRVARRVPILVRNDSGADVDRFAVLGLNDLLIGPDDGNDAEFLREVDFAGDTPALQHRRYCVTEEPIRSGGIGEATLEGLCHARVITGGATLYHARPVPGELHLQGSSGGAFKLLSVASTAAEDGTRLAKCWLSMDGSGHQVGEVIVGQLQQPLAAATWSGGGRREGTTALVRVWDIDPANELTEQARYQYEITGWTPTDPDDLEAGQSLQIETDIRYRLADFHPLHVIDSTSRDRIYTVADGWESSDNWDGTTLTIPIRETIPEVTSGDPPEPVIDGTLVLPGAALLAATDRYELITHRGTTTRPRLATITAIWTGMEWLANIL